VMDDAGNAIGVWEIVDHYSCSHEDGCRSYTLRVRNYSVSDGWGGFRTISSPRLDTTMYPQLAMTSGGTAELVWIESVDMHTRVFAKRYTRRDGWEATQTVSPDADASSPHLAINEDGKAIAVWGQMDGVLHSIFANRHVNGAGWTGPVLVESDNTGDGSSPKVVLDSFGNAVVAWSRYDGQTKFWWNRYSVTTGWGMAGPLGNYTESGFGARVAALRADANGNVILVYDEFTRGPSGGSDAHISAIRYVANVGWGAPVRLSNDADSDERNALLAVDASGNALVTWTWDDGVRMNAWSNRYTVIGGWGTAMLVENFNAGNASVTWLEADASGDVLGLFAEFNDRTMRSYTKRFD
jgi:hypothetical protein